MDTQPAPADALAVLERAFPMTCGQVTIELVRDDASPHVTSAGALRATVRVVNWDDDRRQTVRDILEQEILVCDQRVHELPERLDAGLQAHAIVLGALFATENADRMPSNYFHHEVFRIKTARTVDDFVRALARKSRLDVPSLLDDG